MQAADLGLMTLQNVPEFYRGTSPNKFFDFIAAGKPVLNNYPGWLADMISTRRCGLVVPPDDPEAFADALEYALDTPGRGCPHGAGGAASWPGKSSTGIFWRTDSVISWKASDRWRVARRQ